jgi:hypothetical protein
MPEVWDERCCHTKVQPLPVQAVLQRGSVHTRLQEVHVEVGAW